jgi:formate hydrogenlyase subunit 3/multisubunit Na+/H+ antiporter MnhD subunit
MGQRCGFTNNRLVEMKPGMLLIPILLPTLMAVMAIFIPGRARKVRERISVACAVFLLYFGFRLFFLKNLELSIPWLGYGIDFELRLYPFSSFILLGLSGFLFLIVLYSIAKMANAPRHREYYAYVFLTAAFANGAVLANNFVPLVFFWEGLLLTLYGLITIGGGQSHRTAVKSFLIGGFCDFCMIMGIGILWHLTRTLRMSDVSIVPTGLGAAAFILMMTGAIGKAGAMPFHTWIPDAAIDAPVTVMAFIPAAFEKLLGIYLLARISLDFFKLEVNGPLCIVLMTVGAATIVLAVFMALIQKDLKKLLSFHAVSQVGYMILGIGTGIPIGIAGGIFHMINHAMYKCGLFLSAGSVEHRLGTTELKKLGGLRKEMPVTALGFTVCALAISGVWPLNGFISKEMVFHGALVAAWVGAIFTFASFLKAGHSVFLGPRNPELPKTRESEGTILIPILVLASLCVLFGVYNPLPLKSFIEPILEGRAGTAGHLDFSRHALDLFNPVAGISILCLLAALGIHLYGWNRANKRAHLASEVIHNLPVLKTLYRWSEARVFDGYEQGIRFLKLLSRALYTGVDRTVDFFYEKTVTAVGKALSQVLKKAHNGHYANYLAWCISGLAVIVWVLHRLMR